MPEGAYCVIITDAIGCTTSVCVTVGQILVLTTITNSKNEICHKKNGSATVTVTGGIQGHYTYSWSNGDTSAIDTALTREYRNR